MLVGRAYRSLEARVSASWGRAPSPRDTRWLEARERRMEETMHRLRWVPDSLLVLAIAVSGFPASATTLLPLSDHELADRAQVIVIGRATAQQVPWIGQALTTL